MKDALLEATAVERDLGVHIYTELKFRKQAASAAAKGTQILAVIRRSFERLNQETLPQLYI